MKQILIIFCFCFILLPPRSYSENQEVNIDLFIMSMCPFGIQSEEVLLPIIKKLPEQFKLNIYFVASENSNRDNSEVTEKTEQPVVPQPARNDEACINSEVSSSGRFSSLHGENEVIEDIRQLLILKYFKNQFIDYVLLRNKDIEKTDPATIMKSLGIDSDYIEKAVKSEEGESLLSENIKESKKRNISASPTLFVNGQLIDDRITFNRIYRNLCKHSPMGECAAIPQCGSDKDCASKENMAVACVNPETQDAKCIYGEHIPVKIAVITDQSLPVLMPESMIQTFKNLFPSAVLTVYDYKSEEGKDLLKKSAADFVPAIIFENKVESSVLFSHISQLLKKNEDLYVVKAENLPNRFYINRPYKNKALELFVNSLSENSIRLENILLADNRYSFTVNYNVIVNKKKKENQLLLQKSEDGSYKLAPTDFVYDLRSNYGKEDLMEDIKQLCLSKYNPELISSYLRCFTNESLNHTPTEKCFDFIIKNKDKINKCISQSDGIEMLAGNAVYSKNTEVNSDTAVLINNQILLQEFDFNMIYEILEKNDL